MRVLVKRILILLFALSMVFCFSVRVVPTASAEDTVIHKILTTVTPTPVALLDPATITAATSTPGLSITSAGWFDASGNAVKSAFNPETYKIEIHVKADDGYVIASDVAAYLNNSTVKIDVENSGKTATIYREYTAAIWAPTIIKNPSAETVKEGGWASFAVSASYARDYEWFLEGPDGRQAVSVSDIHLTYPEMSATGNGSTKMNLYHIPYELNGWRVVCNFIGAGTNNSVKSQGALLTVIPTTPREIRLREPVQTLPTGQQMFPPWTRPMQMQAQWTPFLKKHLPIPQPRQRRTETPPVPAAIPPLSRHRLNPLNRFIPMHGAAMLSGTGTTV